MNECAGVWLNIHSFMYSFQWPLIKLKNSEDIVFTTVTSRMLLIVFVYTRNVLMLFTFQSFQSHKSDVYCMAVSAVSI